MSKKLELSLTVTYLPDWHAWEGIRELVQNGKDAETEFNAPLEVTHYNDTLRIENAGARISKEALLFGYTSKAGRGDMRGRWGEGLKIGILALVRAGHDVKIRTGGEVWAAHIARSEKYAADVLCFDCKDGNKDEDRVRVDISGVTKLEWERLKGRFLFLGKAKKDMTVETPRGTLLLDPDQAGQIYVKGIYVQTDKSFTAGYDFKDIEIDRDRRMVGSWNLKWEMSQIWAQAVVTRPDLTEQFFAMMLDGTADVAGLENTANYTQKGMQTEMAAKFVAKFGADAVPVANMGESQEVAHLGKKGIVVSKSLGAVLAQTMGTKDELHKAMREEVTKTLSWNDLTPVQGEYLLHNLQLIQNVVKLPAPLLNIVDIVEFRSPTLMGQCKQAEGRVLIAARLLDDRDELLATLVHEFAHLGGAGDGEKNHVMAIENLWRDIVKSLRG